MRRQTRALLLLAAFTITACSKPIDLDWRHDLGAASLSTPLVTDSYIAMGTEVDFVILELDGRARCRFPAKGEVISAPATDGERIFFGATNYIFYAIKPDCSEAWKFPSRDRIKSDPLVADGRVYISSYDGHLYALNAADGSRIWTFPQQAAEAPPPPKDEPTSPTKGKGKGKHKGKKKAEEDAAAAEAVEDAAPKVVPPPKDVGDFSYSSPVLADGVIYLGNLDGHLYAISADTGRMLWRHKTEGPVTSTPLVHEIYIYFGSNDGHVYAIDSTTPYQAPFTNPEDVDPAGPRTLIWKLRTKEWINSSPHLSGGTLYIGANDRHVYALDAGTGKTRWKFETTGPAIGIPHVYKNLVIAVGGSGDGAIYALQKEDGSLFWKFETGGKIKSDPVVVGNKLYVTSNDGFLYAFTITKTTEE